MKYKYPRTLHVPWSLGISNDDKVLHNMDHFINEYVVVTRKFDGENTSLYRDGFHARSLDSKHHPSRDWVKQFWGTIAYNIPKDYRICGENMFAKHSIFYSNLRSYFLGFSVWDGEQCLGWRDTLDWFSLLGIEPVTVLYEGLYDEAKIRELYKDSDANEHEGYVIRKTSSFLYSDFSNNVAKFVRANHVRTSNHWSQESITKNELIKT